jgi:hypothetical protein
LATAVWSGGKATQVKATQRTRQKKPKRKLRQKHQVIRWQQ